MDLNLCCFVSYGMHACFLTGPLVRCSREVNPPGVKDHGQGHSGHSLAGGHTSRAGDGGPFGLQLYGEGLGDAAQEHVEDAQLVPVALLRGVDDVADVCRRQGLHADDAGESHRGHLWEDTPEQRRHLGDEIQGQKYHWSAKKSTSAILIAAQEFYRRIYCRILMHYLCRHQ